MHSAAASEGTVLDALRAHNLLSMHILALLHCARLTCVLWLAVEVGASKYKTIEIGL